jgi:ferredoxin
MSGGLVRADVSRCRGYVSCVLAADDVFDLGPDGTVVVLVAEPAPDRMAAVQAAVEACPTAALTLLAGP